MKGKDKVKKWVRDYLAHEVVKAEFDQRHPKGKRPNWLDLYMTTRSYEEKNGDYIVSIVLEYRFLPTPEEHWKQTEKGPLLVSTDPVTGEEKIVICDGGIPVPPKIIFQARADLGRESGEMFTAADIDFPDRWRRFYPDVSVTVIKEVNLDELERSEYRPLRCQKNDDSMQ